MAKVTPAYIEYYIGTSKETIRFHAVMQEEHEASSIITKYTTQAGFKISNHAIRENRKVGLTAVITNTVIEGGETGYVYSKNNTRTIKDALDALVVNAVPCTVTTNLGVYTNVIFNKFKNKQEAGRVDSALFVLKGEEVMVDKELFRTAPKRINFSLMDATEEGAVRAELLAAFIDVPDDSKITKSTIDIGSDYVVRSRDAAGNPIDITYICTGQDPVTGHYSYEVHSSDTETNTNEESVFDIFSLDSYDPSGGASAAGACLVEGLVNIAGEQADEIISTAQGELKKSVYGALYKATNMTDSPLGQQLIGLAIDCFIAGAVGGTTKTVTADDYDTTLPSASDMAGGAAQEGAHTTDQVTRILAPTTFYKVENNTANQGVFGELR